MIWQKNLPRTKEQVLEEMELNSIPEPNTGCILWTGTLSKYGYGKIFFEKKHWTTHRLSYHLNVESIPEGKFVCHKCDTRACINPEHLFLGTPLVNMQDKVRKGRLRNQNMDKTHCKHGHEFTSENTRWDKTTIGNPKRVCITCYVGGYKRRNKLKLEKRFRKAA